MTDTGTAAARIALEPEPSAGDLRPRLLGHSRAFCRLQENIARVAAGDAPVLLRGEAGSGRSLAARAIHWQSGRAHEPFVVVSCSDNPETLLETELFGCARGAVVGASSDRHGVLDMAHGGLVLLEDIDQMSPRTQSLLVRFLETGEVHKIGALHKLGTPADVRVLATVTVGAKRGKAHATGLRPELGAHFAGADLLVPPLRERGDDIPVLADYFARAAAERLGLPVTIFSPQAHNALEAYPWPGNVGELKQVVQRVVADARLREVRAEDLPVGIRPRLLRVVRGPGGRRPVADALFARLGTGGESFWTCVYPLFMRREITRMDVRHLVQRGLDAASGDRDGLMRVFNMPPGDRRRFERFLRRYKCERVTATRAGGSVSAMVQSDKHLLEDERQRATGPGRKP